MGGSLLTSLTSLLGPGDSVMSGWTCSTTGYASGSRAYLSLAVPATVGFYPGGLDVWNYVGGWSPFSADDLTYDGTFASFTVTSFGSFAVTGVAVMPGDANRDGQVDINDLTIVLTNFGRTGRAGRGLHRRRSDRQGGHQRSDHRAGELRDHLRGILRRQCGAGAVVRHIAWHRCRRLLAALGDGGPDVRHTAPRSRQVGIAPLRTAA